MSGPGRRRTGRRVRGTRASRRPRDAVTCGAGFPGVVGGAEGAVVELEGARAEVEDRRQRVGGAGRQRVHEPRIACGAVVHTGAADSVRRRSDPRRCAGSRRRAGLQRRAPGGSTRDQRLALGIDVEVEVEVEELDGQPELVVGPHQPVDAGGHERIGCGSAAASAFAGANRHPGRCKAGVNDPLADRGRSITSHPPLLVSAPLTPLGHGRHLQHQPSRPSDRARTTTKGVRSMATATITSFTIDRDVANANVRLFYTVNYERASTRPTNVGYRAELQDRTVTTPSRTGTTVPLATTPSARRLLRFLSPQRSNGRDERRPRTGVDAAMGHAQ